jgi:hypothetical protein
MPALPVAILIKKIYDQLDSFKFKIEHINYDISLMDASFLYFLKSIYLFDLQGIYDIEYALRKNLNFTIADLNELSFPECNLMLKMYNRDVSEKSKESDQVDSSS